MGKYTGEYNSSKPSISEIGRVTTVVEDAVEHTQMFNGNDLQDLRSSGVHLAHQLGREFTEIKTNVEKDKNEKGEALPQEPVFKSGEGHESERLGDFNLRHKLWDTQKSEYKQSTQDEAMQEFAPRLDGVRDQNFTPSTA